MTLVLNADTTLVAVPVNSGRPVCVVVTALPLLGTRNPTVMVTTGAGGGRFSDMMGDADKIGVVEAVDDEGDRTGVSKLDVL